MHRTLKVYQLWSTEEAKMQMQGHCASIQQCNTRVGELRAFLIPRQTCLKHKRSM